MEAFILSDDDNEDYNDLEEDVFVDPGFTPEEYYSDEENADCNIPKTPGDINKSCAKITRLIQLLLPFLLGKEGISVSPRVSSELCARVRVFSLHFNDKCLIKITTRSLKVRRIKG